MSFSRSHRKTDLIVKTKGNSKLGPGSYIGLNEYKTIPNIVPFNSSILKINDFNSNIYNV